MATTATWSRPTNCAVRSACLEHALDKQLGNETTTFIRIGKRFIVNKRYICKVNIPKQRLVITDYDRFTFQLPISRDALKQLKALITLSTEKK